MPTLHDDAALICDLFTILKEARGYPNLRPLHDAAMGELQIISDNQDAVAHLPAAPQAEPKET